MFISLHANTISATELCGKTHRNRRTTKWYLCILYDHTNARLSDQASSEVATHETHTTGLLLELAVPYIIAISSSI